MPSSCPPHNHPHQGTHGRARCMPDLRRGQRIARHRARAAPRGAAASASLGRGWLGAEHNTSTMTPTTNTNTPGPCCTQLDPEEPPCQGHGRYWTLRSCFAGRGSGVRVSLAPPRSEENFELPSNPPKQRTGRKYSRGVRAAALKGPGLAPSTRLINDLEDQSSAGVSGQQPPPDFLPRRGITTGDTSG
jgi:hypothetical protein